MTIGELKETINDLPDSAIVRIVTKVNTHGEVAHRNMAVAKLEGTVVLLFPTKEHGA